MEFRNLGIKEKQEILKDILSRFDLKPLSFEGGYFNETFRSEKMFFNEDLTGEPGSVQNQGLVNNNTFASKGKFAETAKAEKTAGLKLEKSVPLRSLCTCILYLITRESFSRLHRLPGEEVFHFYFGDPVKMLNICKNGKAKIITLGNDFKKGEVPQHVVEGNCWQGAFLSESQSSVFALLGTTMSPGFDLTDYEKADNCKDELIKNHPEFSEVIKKLV